jgi:cyclophilin family peptidyl-prolyl cis-trans isomerase/HEAT repeat protein
MRLLLLTLALAAAAPPAPAAAQGRPPLTAAHVDDLATILQLEDTRQLDEDAFKLLEGVRADSHPDVAAAVVFATGQLRRPEDIPWLGGLLSNRATAPAIAREAAQALGKIPANQEGAAQARAELARYLASATETRTAAPVIGEALLSWGRFTGPSDLGPVVRWIASPDAELRWRAAWALFRPRDPAAAPHLLKASHDESAEVRSWAVRGLIPAVVDKSGVDRGEAMNRLRLLASSDRDRRVRTEALRALLQHEDERAFTALVNALYSPDMWLAVSAAEAATRFPDRARVLASVLVDIAESEKTPVALRIVSLQSLVTLAPEATKTFELAAALAKSPVFAARSAAVQALGRLGDEGRALLTTLSEDPAAAPLAQPGGQTFAEMAKAQLARGAGGRGGDRGAGGGRGAQAPRAARPADEYRALVERWIVPAYNGAAPPRAIWETARGAIEIELHAADAPLGAEHFLRVVESGDIVGTEFTRLVPNFVAQQQPIRNAVTLRDEVNQHGLTRGNLSWASAGLDTGRPGYTLGHTPQPHNEGNFTSLGRVVRGMDVVDRLELGDAITAARMVSGGR